MGIMTYCKFWNEVLIQPGQVYGVEHAHKLHDQRQPYTVVVEMPTNEIVVVEMCFYKVYCHVVFLDEQKRNAVRYGFEPAGDGRIFLAEIEEHLYRGEERFSHYGKTTMFHEDGTTAILEGTAKSPASRRELPFKVDVSNHYEPEPEFGRYDSLIRFNREIAPEIAPGGFTGRPDLSRYSAARPPTR